MFQFNPTSFHRPWFALVSLLILNSCSLPKDEVHNEVNPDPGVAVLLVDTNRKMGTIKEEVYGHFLEHINHSVVDGLYGEQVQGQGFEGVDFETYWQSFGEAELVEVPFKSGAKSVRLTTDQGRSGIRQDRFYIQQDKTYSGAIWLKNESGDPSVRIKLVGASEELLAEQIIAADGDDWQEVPFRLAPVAGDTMAILEIEKSGEGSVLVDFISLMTEEVRANGGFRTDLLESLEGLAPPFIRWPGGSFASIYKWKDGIGPRVSRKFNPNSHWGDYSDYYGFGTHEFLALCEKLGSDPMIVLKATTTDPDEVRYAMDWVHYLIDPISTEWGKLRASNGHPEPYDIPYFQIDNEPMNHNLGPDEYAEIVNVYGSRLREIAPDSKIVACGQKRSNDMIWTQKMVDIAGDHFDILGVHNYEYEPENFQTGVRRIEDYLEKAIQYIAVSGHPEIELAVLEWGLCRSYDWRAGLHAAGSLISYEKLTQGLTMSCPALLMRNTTDDPTWTAFIYHDHVYWFPGGGYVVEELFRDHYEPVYLASTSGTFSDIPDKSVFFDEISQMKPEDWKPGTVDAIATSSTDGKRVVIKVVNYEGNENKLLLRLQGKELPAFKQLQVHTLQADLLEKADLEHPNKIVIEQTTIPYQQDPVITLEPYSVKVIVLE